MNIRSKSGAIVRPPSASRRWAGLLAILLLVFGTMLQATHVHDGVVSRSHTSAQLDHPGDTGQDGTACALCAAMHSLQAVDTAELLTATAVTQVEPIARVVQAPTARLTSEAFGRPPPSFV